jgi:hypothetical protein
MSIDWVPVVIITLLVIGMMTLRIGSFPMGGGGDLTTIAAAGMDIGAIFNQGIRIVLSIAVLGASLWVILKGGYQDATEKWAFGAVGTVLGHWLKR